MGQSQGRMTPAHAAEMACMLDPAPGEDDHCRDGRAGVPLDGEGLEECGEGRDADDPRVCRGPARVRAPAGGPRNCERCSRRAAAETYAVGAPECPGGFVQGPLLPGKVETDGWDNVPVSGYKHDICHPEYADGDVPYTELARKHPGDGAGPPSFLGTTADGYDNNTFAPTTRAGGRVLVRISRRPTARSRRSTRPTCQILVRHDA